MMLDKKYTKPLGQALAAGLMTAWLSTGAIASGPNESVANDVDAQPVSTQTQAPTTADLMEMASDYSVQEGGRVGVYIHLAPDPGISPDQLGKAIVNKFASEGITAAYIYGYALAGESTVDYYMNGTPYLGYSLGAAPEGFKEVVSAYKGMHQDVASSEEIHEDNPVLAFGN